MSDNYELVGNICRSLASINDHWPALLIAPSSQKLGGPRGGVSTRGVPEHDPINDPLGVMVEDDHLDTDADMDRATRAVALSRLATDILNGWCRVVVEDRPVTTVLPNGLSVPSMVEFMERHADWMADHDAAEDCASELSDLAKRIGSLVAPTRKEWHHLGSCPLTIERDEDAPSEICNGRVRVPIGGDQSEASCSRCEVKATIRWWEEAMGRFDEVVGSVEMARQIFVRLHVRISERTVRNWARSGRIKRFIPFGPEPREIRWWFSVRSVLDEVAHMDRECPMCGRLWSGTGEVCLGCYQAMRTATRRYAEPKLPTPAAISLRPVRVVPDSHNTDRPERCHFSDLPMNQCACGRAHRVSA